MTNIKNIGSTKFNDVKLFKLTSHNDERGSFREIFNKEVQSLAGDTVNFVQDNESRSKYGVLRGLHFQKAPNEQAKLIRVSYGMIQDVVVDIRRGSPTFLDTFSIELTEKNKKMLFIPKGFAHGFQTLDDNTELLYFHSSIYTPSNEGALNIKDPLLGIKWPLDITSFSERDNEHKYFLA